MTARRPLDRVAIVVSGGVVQDVLCDQPHDVILIDYDNIEQGDDIAAYPDSVDAKALDRVLREARAAVRENKRRRPE